MIRTLLTTALIALTAFSFPVLGENLYKKGTAGHAMADLVREIAGPDAIPFFTIRGNNQHYFFQLDMPRAMNAGLPFSEMDKDLEMPMMSSGENARMGSFQVEDSDKRICFMTLTENLPSGTLFHEAIHCKNSEHWDSMEYKRLVAAAYLHKKTDMNPNKYFFFFEEALTAHLTVAYAANKGMDAANKGMDAALEGVKVIASRKSNEDSSFGMRVARSALELCGRKGACSLDSMEMATYLAGSVAFKDALHADAEELESLLNLAALGYQ